MYDKTISSGISQSPSMIAMSCNRQLLFEGRLPFHCASLRHSFSLARRCFFPARPYPLPPPLCLTSVFPYLRPKTLSMVETVAWTPSAILRSDIAIAPRKKPKNHNFN